MNPLVAVLLAAVLSQSAIGSPAARVPEAPSSAATPAAPSRPARGRDYRALIKAVERGDLAKVKALIKRGVDVNGGDAPDTLYPVNRPIVTAAAKGRTDLVDVLLNAGANPNTCCCSCVTALHEAIRGGHTSVVARLLKGGANPRQLYDGSKSPLDLARERGVAEIAMLIEKRLAESE